MCFSGMQSLMLNDVRTKQFDHLVQSTLIYFDCFLKLKQLEAEEMDRRREK